MNLLTRLRFFHIAWSSPIGLIICLVLLLVNLGPSALAGFAIFFIGSPIQTWVMKRLFTVRKKAMEWTDKRAKLLQELLGGMRVIKFFAWEVCTLATHFFRLLPVSASIHREDWRV